MMILLSFCVRSSYDDLAYLLHRISLRFFPFYLALGDSAKDSKKTFENFCVS